LNNLLPTSMTFEFRNFGEESVRFKFTAYFSKSSQHDIQKKFEIATKHAKKYDKTLKVKRVGLSGINVSGHMLKKVFGTMMALEFMQWTNLGSLTLSELITY